MISPIGGFNGELANLLRLTPVSRQLIHNKSGAH
jgi:hypothetical protein